MSAAENRLELRLPDFDLPGTPVTVCSWHANAGQRVTEGDRLVEILAGDATIDLAAPASGLLLERCVPLDQPLAPGTCLAVIQLEQHDA
jgi:pyruvate/2-oxoglutarate dehydrogenase complex dihydrolipoamide acyltransferase (E2) component